MTSPEPIEARLRSIAQRSGSDLSVQQVTKLVQYLDLLDRWNRRMNLTALPLEGLPEASLDRLVGEPLLAATLVPHDASVWFDLGSGGGSPAIPLKIARPELRLTMVESRARKAAFLREALRVTALRNASVMNCRIEDLSKQAGMVVDLVSIRGLRIDVGVAHAVLAMATPRARLLLFGPADWTFLQPQFKPIRSLDGLFLLQRIVPRGT